LATGKYYLLRIWLGRTSKQVKGVKGSCEVLGWRLLAHSGGSRDTPCLASLTEPLSKLLLLGRVEHQCNASLLTRDGGRQDDAANSSQVTPAVAMGLIRPRRTDGLCQRRCCLPLIHPLKNPRHSDFEKGPTL
jgi:hypothetical protein